MTLLYSTAVKCSLVLQQDRRGDITEHHDRADVPDVVNLNLGSLDVEGEITDDGVRLVALKIICHDITLDRHAVGFVCQNVR